MDNKIFDGFYDKFNVSTRPGRGGKYAFVPANDVTDRMNRLFLGNWCTEVKSQDVYEDGTVIVRVKVSVLDPETKMWFYHEGFGGHKDAGGEPGSSFKSAYSKALVNACRRWGVGLYLDEDDESNASTDNINMPGTAARPVQALSRQGLPPAPSKPAGPPTISSPPIILQQVPSPVPVQSMPKIPEPMHGAHLNGGHMMPEPSPVQTQRASTIPGSMSTTTETPSIDMISDVQKIAIQSLYDMRSYKYEDLAQAVLGSVPDVNTLTHDQAVLIIQYGNDLYKKNKTN